MVGERSKLRLPGLEIADGVLDEGSLPRVHGVDDALLGFGERVGSELLEEGLEAECELGGPEGVALMNLHGRLGTFPVWCTLEVP